MADKRVGIVIEGKAAIDPAFRQIKREFNLLRAAGKQLNNVFTGIGQGIGQRVTQDLVSWIDRNHFGDRPDVSVLVVGVSESVSDILPLELAASDSAIRLDVEAPFAFVVVLDVDAFDLDFDEILTDRFDKQACRDVATVRREAAQAVIEARRQFSACQLPFDILHCFMNH